ncbi:MAG: 50S ribosomal protein L9 [Spirochaetales bacterium]
MKVILTVDVKGTGKKGDVVTVSDGFAKNFLLPQKKAIMADNTALNQNKLAKEAAEFHEEEHRKQAKEECDKINGKTITVEVKAGENGKVFGSVTNKEIAEQIKTLGIEIDKRKIELSAPIKQTGIYSVTIKFYKGIVAKVKVEVVSA